jgi:hypothetical protein
MRKLAISIGVAVIGLALAVAVSSAADNARLDGQFKVTGTVKSTDINGLNPGDKNHDTYTFKGCDKAGCAKVQLTRDAGGRNVKSTLKKIKPGVYKGKEGPENYTCISPILNPGHFSGVNKIKITDSHKGKATEIAGTSKVTFTGCDETFENTKIKGTLKK